MVVDHEEVEFFFAFFFMDGREEHAAGVDAHHSSRWQVDNRDEGLANEFFRFIECMDAGEDDAVGACAVVENEFQEFLGFLDGFAALDFDCSEVRFAECIEVYIVCEEWFYFGFGEVDFAVRLEESIVACFCHGSFFSSFRVCFFLCGFRFHSREEDDVADAGGVGHEHEETIKADAEAACRRHAVFEGGEEVFIDRMSFVVAVCSFFYLHFETFSLIDRVV